MLNCTVVLFLTFLIAANANAVDAVVCEKNGEIKIEIADIYEAQRLRKFDFSEVQSQPDNQLESILWNKLQTKSKARLQFFQTHFSNFLKMTRLQPNIRFEKNWTNSYVFIEKNCRVQTFAEVYKKQFSMDPDFIIDQEIWNKLSSAQKLITKTHLLFTKESKQNHLTETAQIQMRYYNSLFWSSLWETLPTQQLFKLSKKLLFETESYQDLLLLIQDASFQFWDENTLQSGTLQPGATGTLSSGARFVQNYGIFQQDINGNIQLLPHRSELEFQTPLGILKSQNCLTQFYENLQLKHTCFSSEQNIQLKNKNWEAQYLKQNAPTYFYPNGQIYSARNIEGKFKTNWGQIIRFQAQGEKQFAEVHWNDQGNIIYLAQILDPIRFQTKAGLIETTANTFASFYPSGNLKCTQNKNKTLLLKNQKMKTYKIEGVGFCLTEEGYYHPPGEDKVYLSFTDSFQIKDHL